MDSIVLILCIVVLIVSLIALVALFAWVRQIQKATLQIRNLTWRILEYMAADHDQALSEQESADEQPASASKED